MNMPTNSTWYSLNQLVQCIDHTQLKPGATREEIIRICQQALEYQFVSVCIPPCYVSLASEALRTSRVKVGTVVGFPLGAQTPAVKARETVESLENGAREIDMVIHLGALKNREFAVVEKDIRSIAGICHGSGPKTRTSGLLKVIIETCLLTDEEKRIACRLCVNGGADMVKTSTGFGAFGATVKDVRLLHEEVAPHGLGVKASGGIRTLDDALSMLRAGAVRLGTSSGVAIVRELRQRMQAKHPA